MEKMEHICPKFGFWCLVGFLLCVCCFGKDWKGSRVV